MKSHNKISTSSSIKIWRVASILKQHWSCLQVKLISYSPKYISQVQLRRDVDFGHSYLTEVDFRQNAQSRIPFLDLAWFSKNSFSTFQYRVSKYRPRFHEIFDHNKNYSKPNSPLFWLKYDQIFQWKKTNSLWKKPLLYPCLYLWPCTGSSKVWLPLMQFFFSLDNTFLSCSEAV